MKIQNIKTVPAMLVLASLIFLTSACGGGGGGGGGSVSQPASAPVIELHGTVAVGKPLAGMKVEVFTTNSSIAAQSQSTTTDAEGKYSFNNSVNSLYIAAPYVIVVTNPQDSTYPVMLSFALKRGVTANVTPLTDLVVSQILNKPIGSGYTVADGPLIASATDSTVRAANQKVIAYLLTHPSKNDQSLAAPIDVSMITDFLTQDFNATSGDVYDDALERLTQGLAPGENIYSLREQMLNGTAQALDLQAQSAGRILCEGDRCSTVSSNDSNPHPPYIAKSSLVQAIMQQIKNDIFVHVDCGTAPQLSGVNAGSNMLFVDGTILRVNNFLGPSIPLTSLVDLGLTIDNTATVPQAKYITQFSGQSSYVADSGAVGIGMVFNTDATIQWVSFSNKDGEVICNRI